MVDTWDQGRSSRSERVVPWMTIALSGDKCWNSRFIQTEATGFPDRLGVGSKRNARVNNTFQVLT